MTDLHEVAGKEDDILLRGHIEDFDAMNPEQAQMWMNLVQSESQHFVFQPTSVEDVQDYAKRDKIRVFIVDDHILGTYSLEIDENRDVSTELRYFVVDKSFRRRGIGRTLMQDAIDNGIGNVGVTTAIVEGSDAMLGLMASFGFAEYSNRAME
mgnify:CR=1 FL=1